MNIYGLVDCNNFYASCERVFEPNLQGRPIVVLSNNDGCVIARSNEAKEMGIPMGEPFFKVKALQRDGLVVRSSNYALYGDMAARVMGALSHFVPDIEVYSIDESFIHLDGFEHLHLREYALTIRQTILQWTGIPVSIGIGPTKTLSKVAAHFAKKQPERQSVDVLLTKGDILYGLANLPIEDVWGIGRRWARKLKGDGIHFAIDLANAPDSWIRKRMGIVGLRTALELRGTPCQNVDTVPSDKQTICVSRSFGKMLSELQELEEAIKTFAMRACEKLRRGKLTACHISVFIRTNVHRADQPQYKASLTLALDYPTNDSRLIARTMLTALRRIYRTGYSYKQAGVYLLELTREEQATGTLFAQENPKSPSLMKALDNINKRYGEGSLNIGQCKKSRSWYTTRDHASPRYTTSWHELPEVGYGTSSNSRKGRS